MRKQLLAWYRAHRRVLPWRNDPPNPYHTFVSEAMLQQTQVGTVIAYFNRFIEAFPTVNALAAADEQKVLHLWQGLGYYRRARNLHAAAKKIVAEFGGEVPRTVEELLELPGVGRYTAGAIASIGHGERAPILDGNVARVLARMYGLREPIDEKKTQAELWRLAGELVDPKSPGDFNQAMMELGALVCTPKSPGCLVCPWKPRCQALERGLVDELPVKTPKKKPVEVEHLVAVLENRGQYGFAKRPEKGLWSNLWEFPTLELKKGQAGTLGQLKEWLEETVGLRVSGLKEIGEFRHQTTHRTIRFRVFRGTSADQGDARGGLKWKSLGSVDELPMSNPQRRVKQMVA